MAEITPTSLVKSISGTIKKDDPTYCRKSPSGKTITCAMPEKTPLTLGSRRMELQNNFAEVAFVVDSFINTPSEKLDLFRTDFDEQLHYPHPSKKQYFIFRNYCLARLMAEASNTPFPPSAHRKYPRTPRKPKQ